jgi:hypothetical protein
MAVTKLPALHEPPTRLWMLAVFTLKVVPLRLSPLPALYVVSWSALHCHALPDHFHT